MWLLLAALVAIVLVMSMTPDATHKTDITRPESSAVAPVTPAPAPTMPAPSTKP
jgi:hypothetical protein